MIPKDINVSVIPGFFKEFFLLFFCSVIVSVFVGHAHVKFCNIFHIERPGTIYVLPHENTLRIVKFNLSPFNFLVNLYLLVQIDVEILDSSLGSLLLTLWTCLGRILRIVMLLSGHFILPYSDTASEKAN